MKRTVASIVLALVFSIASLAQASVTAKGLIGTWSGSLDVEFNGEKMNSKVSMIFQAGGAMKIVHDGKEEAARYKVESGRLIFLDKDGTKTEATLENATMTKSSLSGHLKPATDEMPPGMTVKLNLQRQK